MLDGPQILGFQALVRRVIIAPQVQDVAVRAVLATHPEGEFATPMSKRFLRFGASPRAAQSLVLGAKVRALLEGRAHVSVEDIGRVLTPALRHRILLNFEGQAEAITTDDVVAEIDQMVVRGGAVAAGKGPAVVAKK